MTPIAVRNFVLACAAALLIPSLRALADDWALTDTQFHTSDVQLVAIGDNGPTVAAANGSASAISWQDVLELGHAVAPAQPDPYELFLIGGDHIGGSPAGVVGDDLQWKNSALGELNFPLDRIAAIGAAEIPAAKLAATRVDDLVQLANGDVTHGIVADVSPAGVTLQSGDTTTTLPWTAVTAVLFSTTAQTAAPPTTRMFRINLADGSTLSVPAVTLTGTQITLTLDDKSTRAVDVSTVGGIEQLNGPISWLTEHRPIENTYKPFFNEWYPARFDETVADGQPISQKFPGFHHGIGCHAFSRIAYALNGDYAGFRTQFAVDSDSLLADVTVRIYLDDKVVTEQKNVKSGRIYPLLVIPLGEAKKLSLEVDYGDNYATQARFAWLDPALIRRLPPAPSGGPPAQ